MDNKNIRNGFTLVELIISLVILALLSLGVLRLFISAQVNHFKASDLDHAVLVSTTLAEELRSISNEEIKDESLILYYDRQWEKTEKLTDSSLYALYADIVPMPDTNEGLYTVHIRVTRLNAYPFEKKGETEIYKMSSTFEGLKAWGKTP